MQKELGGKKVFFTVLYILKVTKMAKNGPKMAQIYILGSEAYKKIFLGIFFVPNY